MKKLFVAALLLTLAGCASPAQRAQDQREMNASIPTCRTQKQCEAIWSAASTWVSAHCGMKIQTETENLIETFNSPPYSPLTSCKVSKVQGPGHMFALDMYVACANIFGCQPSGKDQVLAFGAAMKEAGAPFEPLKLGVDTQQIDSFGKPTVVLAEATGLKVTHIYPGGRA